MSPSCLNFQNSRTKTKFITYLYYLSLHSDVVCQSCGEMTVGLLANRKDLNEMLAVIYVYAQNAIKEILRMMTMHHVLTVTGVKIFLLNNSVNVYIGNTLS